MIKSDPFEVVVVDDVAEIFVIGAAVGASVICASSCGDTVGDVDAVGIDVVGEDVIGAVAGASVVV